MFLSESSFQGTDMHPVGSVEIMLAFDIFDHKFRKGLDQFPPVGAKVYACSVVFLQEFLKGFGASENEKDLINFASLTDQDSGDINISCNALFNRHCAIVGSTGGGKSYTIAKIISEVMKKPDAKMILIDATGEFSTFKGSDVMNAVFCGPAASTDTTYFHYSNLREEDLYALFRPAGQVQLPKLQQAIKSLKMIKKANEVEAAGGVVDSLFKGSIQSVQGQSISMLLKSMKDRNIFIKATKMLPDDFMMQNDFEIRSLPYQIYNECIYESDFDKPQLYGKANDRDRGNCESLITRISLILQTRHFENVFAFNVDSSAITGSELESKISTFLQDPEKKLLRIDLGQIPEEQKIREVLVNAIGRNLLEKARTGSFKTRPVIVFVDEAHQFLNKKIRDEYSIEVELNAFDRIAKECRKFGLFLSIATQRPRDIPEGVLSQMGAFLVHRLINHYDREAIERAASEASKHALSFLPVLGRGEALLMGVEFPMPLILRVQESAVIPDSKTPALFN
jgi:energy-coupling factor transporter ATP-binding protein EcfA2